MRSLGRPSASANWALRIADVTSASRITLVASSGLPDIAFSSIRLLRRSWSRLPQFTPMRTGLPNSMAFSMIIANCGSCLLPLPTLPGLIRYFASARAQSGKLVSSLCPLK